MLTVPQGLQTAVVVAGVLVLAAAAQFAPAVRAVRALLFCLFQPLGIPAQQQVRRQLRLLAPTQF
jgi:hypothetical protein